MIANYSKKVILITAVILITGSFFFGVINSAGVAQASFLDIIQALVTINPLKVEIIAPKEELLNQAFKIEVTVINSGEGKVGNTQAEIFLPDGLSLVTKKQINKLGAIPPNKDKETKWLVKGGQSGNFIILVSAQGEIKEQVVTAEATALITILDIINPAKTKGPNFVQRVNNWWLEVLNFFRTD